MPEFTNILGGMTFVVTCRTEPTTRDGQPWHMAVDPRYPGCISDGETPEQACRNLDDARELWLSEHTEV